MGAALRRRGCFVLVVMVLSVPGAVEAATINLKDQGPAQQLWALPENWDIGTVPTAADNVRVNVLPGALIVNDGAVANNLYVGIAGTGALTVAGGTLTTTLACILAHNPGNEGTFNMMSGAVTIGGNLTVGYQGVATLNINGGTVTAKTLKIAELATAVGHVNLHGGILTAPTFQMRNTAGAVGTIDVTAGTLIVNGNKLSVIQGYLDNGWITAYGGFGGGTLHLDYDVTNKGTTTLTATSVLNPSPADGGSVEPGAVELSWTPRDPCVPGQPVPVNVYFTDDLEALEQFLDPAALRIVDHQSVTSVVVQTKPKTRYYWAVDSFLGDPNDPVLGPIFSFVADNVPPRVAAGSDIVTWLENGTRTGDLDATVTDEDAYTVQWSVVSEPNVGTAVIQTPTAEDTPVTFVAAGQYVLQLEASDGEYVGSDTVTIHVYRDRCEATRSRPGYQPLVGDLNGDCRVDDLDLALLQENWLKDNLLTDDWLKTD